MPQSSTEITQHIAHRLIDNLRLGGLSDADLLRALGQLTEEQKIDFYEVCSFIYATAITELTARENGISREKTNVRQSFAALKEAQEFVESAEKLCEMVAFFDDHQIRGAIQFNRRILDN
jgi:hypothetical protein